MEIVMKNGITIFIDDDGQHYYIDVNGMHVITDTIESEEDLNDFLDEIGN